MKQIPAWLPLALIAAACSSTANSPKAPPPLSVSPTPTLMPASRVNPNVVEETETGYIERFPKSEYLKVDERHIRLVSSAVTIEFFKEDDLYYYVSVKKALPEEREARRMEPTPTPGPSSVPKGPSNPTVSPSDFQDLTPPRTSSPFRLEAVAESGLPATGMWRASFTIADVNGDGIPDIVAPPPRMGDGQLKIWLGDGKGHFSAWPLTFVAKAGQGARFSVDYGGVAVGDIDHDGNPDIVSASHGGGLVSLFGDGKGGFQVVRTGLPDREFSTQAVALVDAKGDGQLMMVAARDNPPPDLGNRVQVRAFSFLGRDQGWEFRKDAIDGPFSQCLLAWDFDGDGRQDVLLGNHWAGQLRLLWRSQGDGTFSFVPIPVIEPRSFHTTVAPGSIGKGKGKVKAFADSYTMQFESLHSAGISIYAFENGAWTRRQVWRRKDPKASVAGLAMGDLDGDGLDDLVFSDFEARRVRILLQQPDGSFVEISEAAEPALDSPGQCVRLADFDGDGRLDLVVSKTVTSSNPSVKGGWNVYLNRAK